jgi:hypothetical protein
MSEALAADQFILPPHQDVIDDWGNDKYDAIGDSGAGAAIGSIEALTAQGANPEQLEKLVVAFDTPKKFGTAAGIVPATTGIEVTTQCGENTTMHLLKDCPLALSIGEEVSKGYAFVWTPSLFNKPFFANSKYVKVQCPKSRRHEADYVRNNVPHFSVKLDGSRARMSPPGTRSDTKCGGSQFYPHKRGRNRHSKSNRESHIP